MGLTIHGYRVHSLPDYFSGECPTEFELGLYLTACLLASAGF